MLTRIIRQLILVLAFSPISGGSPLQQSPPLTVLDYYLLLPERFFEADREERVNRMLDPKGGAIVDKNNGYLFAPGDGAQTDIYVCLFKRPDGTNVIGVKTHASDSKDYTYLDFYLYRDGNWKDVTKQVLPVAINDELKYEMPRYGTTIKVTHKHGKRFFDLIWGNGIFKIRRCLSLEKNGRNRTTTHPAA